MASQIATERTNRLAVALTATVVLDALGWMFREQETSDFGIDAHVELARDERATGELVALQIKGGASAFKTRVDDGWTFPVSAKHADYWLSHSLPVVLVLADIESQRCYWQIIDSSTLASTGKNFKVLVPRINDLSAASEEWQHLTRRYIDHADELYDLNRQRLPPSAAGRLDELRKTDPHGAAALGADLAAGRGNPQLALDELLKGRRAWMDRHGVLAWATVALYAREHGQFRQAAAAFARLAELRADRRATDLGDAAVMLINVDDVEAMALAESAYAHDPADSAALAAMAYLRPDEPKYAEQLAERDDLRARGYFANMATRRGEDSEAIRLFELILAGAEEQSGVSLELSRLYCRRCLTPHAMPGDLAAARDLALRVLTSRRNWTNSTDGALAAYARTLVLESRYDEALQTVTRPPIGTATKVEAESTEVARIALEVASRLEKFDLLPGIVANISDNAERDLAAEEARLAQGAPVAELITYERSVLARAIDIRDAPRALQAALGLALHGVDESTEMQRLEPLRAYVKLVTVIAASRSNPIPNLAKLRALAKTEIAAAEVVIQILLDLSRYSDAAEACDLYFAIYASASFLSSKVKALYLADEEDAALALLEDAVAKDQLAGKPRYEAHRILARHYGDLQDWERAVHNLRELIARSPVMPIDGFWNLVQSLVASGDATAARALIDEHRIDPATEREIAVWLRVVSATGWTESTASLAVTLALTEGVTPELATSLVGTIVLETQGASRDDDDMGEIARAADARPVVNGDIHRRAFEVMERLTSEHGDQLAIRHFDADVGTLIDELKRMFPPERVRPFRALARQVAAGSIPIGFLSEIRNDPYGLILADRYHQPRVASSPDAADHQAETDAALASLNGRVVVDLSAVELAMHLDTWSECEGQFNVVAIPAAQRIDAQRSVVNARSATGSGGRLGVDADGVPYMTEFDPAAQMETLRRCESVERATRALMTVDLGEELTFAADLNGLGFSAWITSIEAAGRQGVPLWSDDVAQRRLARDLRIPAFGTVNLLEGLRLSRLGENAEPYEVIEVSEGQHAFVRRLLELRVVDQPVTLEDVLENIAGHPGDLAPAADIVSRAAWWRTGKPLEDWIRILEEVRQCAPDNLRVWQARAMNGIIGAAPAEAASRFVAALAAIGTAELPNVLDVAEGFQMGDQICRHHELPSASSHLAWAVSAAASMSRGVDPESFAEEVRARMSSPRDTQAAV